MRRPTLSLAVLILVLTAASGQRGPVIVANVNLIHQLMPIQPITIVTPSKNALYRITAALEITKQNRLPGSWCVDFGYTDALGPEKARLKVFTDSLFGPIAVSKVIVAPDKAGVPLTYTVVACPNGIQDDTVPFDLFATVEQLQ